MSKAQSKHAQAHCVEGFSIIEEIREGVQDLSDKVVSTLENQSLDEMVREVDCAVKDLLEYRSHITRHKAESIFDAKELKQLLDNMAKVICDWKMKVPLDIF